MLVLLSLIILINFLGCHAIPVNLLPEKTETEPLGETKPCHADENQPCEIDGYVGTSVIYEDHLVRVWNFTLAPGEMTSMHAHDYDYHFVAIQPTQLEVWGTNGDRLFDFRAEGVLGFKLSGDLLVPINIELPFPVPRIHAAKNIGDSTYYEILYESKVSTAAATQKAPNEKKQQAQAEL